MNNIRNKLLLAFVGVALLPVLVIGIYSVSSTSTALGEAGAKQLATKVSLLSAGLEDFLADVSSDVSVLADSVSLGQLFLAMDTRDARLIDAAKGNLARDFLSMSRNRGVYHRIRFIDRNGNEVARVDRSDDLSSVIPESQFQNHRGRYYFDDTIVLAAGEFLVSPLDLNREQDEVEEPIRPVIRYGTPVFDKKQRLQGVIVVNVQADNLLKMVKDAAGKDESVLFVDSRGFYLSHPNAKKTWGGEADLGTGESLKKDEPGVAAKILSASGVVSLESDDSLVAAAPVRIGVGDNRVVGVVADFVPKSAVLGPASSVRTVFIVLLLISIGLAGVVGYAVSGTIVGPLLYLTEATDGMGRGVLDKNITVDSSDEIKDLSVAIERMRKSMKIMMDKYS